MTDVVYLHIGEPKTGTTSLQATLTRHKEALAADGLLVPGRRRAQVRASLEVLGRTDVPMGSWRALAADVVANPGRAAVISMESLVRATSGQIENAVAEFAGVPVQVIVTVRDLARVIPAQWQESLQFGSTWTFEEYLDGITGRWARLSRAGRSFWGQHDTPRIVQRWADVVGRDRVSVVTVPVSGQPGQLWQRFGAAVGIDAAKYPEEPPGNVSLGAASAELLRRINEALRDRPPDSRTYARMYRSVLAKGRLAERRDQEARLAVPEHLSSWLIERRTVMCDALAASGAVVYGDLADLVPPLPPPGSGTTSRTGATDAEVSAAAIDAIVRLLDGYPR